MTVTTPRFKFMGHKPRVILQQTAIADYRREVLQLLDNHWGNDLEILVGRVYFEPTTRTSTDLPGNITFVSNRFLLGRRLLWQHGVIRRLIAADTAIVELNPRIISVWTALVCRKLLRRHTIAWGHAWSRRGSTSRTESLRHIMRLLADTLLVYTDTQRQELLRKTPRARVITAPNALYRQSQMTASFTNAPNKIVFSGRLVAAKKPMLLLEAYALAVDQGLSHDYILVFVGDGPERSHIETKLRNFRHIHHLVEILGHVPSSQMPDIYKTTLVSVSPGYVGLSITQSFSFGVPMIISRDEPHSPEIEAAIEGVNAIFVTSNSAQSLATALLSVTSRSERWLKHRTSIVLDCETRYSAEKMAKGIIMSTESKS